MREFARRPDVKSGVVKPGKNRRHTPLRFQADCERMDRVVVGILADVIRKTIIGFF